MEGSGRGTYKKNKMLLIDYLPYLTVLPALTESFHVLRDRYIENKEVKKNWESRKGIIIMYATCLIYEQ